MVVLNVKKLAVLRANEVALIQATKQFSQLHDKACVENARLCYQEAVLTAALGLQETEVGYLHTCEAHECVAGLYCDAVCLHTRYHEFLLSLCQFKLPTSHSSRQSYASFCDPRSCTLLSCSWLMEATKLLVTPVESLQPQPQLNLLKSVHQVLRLPQTLLMTTCFLMTSWKSYQQWRYPTHLLTSLIWLAFPSEFQLFGL